MAPIFGFMSESVSFVIFPTVHDAPSSDKRNPPPLQPTSFHVDASSFKWPSFILVVAVFARAGRHLVAGNHGDRAGERGAAPLGAPSHEGLVPHPKE